LHTPFVPPAGAGTDIVPTEQGSRFLVPSRELSDPAGHFAATSEQESFLRRFWRVLVKRRWVVLGVIFASLLAGITAAMLTQPIYGATVSVEIARATEEVIELGQEKSRAPAGADAEFYQTQYTLLRSRSLAEGVVRDLRLAQNEDFLAGYGASSVADLPANAATRFAMATDVVMANTKLVPVRLSSVVNIRHESASPEMAARIANSLAENFIQFNLAKRFEASSYAREFLQKQIAQTRQRLEESERNAVGYAARNQIINIAPTTTTADGQVQGEQSLVGASLAAANAALADARAARIAAESRYRQSGGQPMEALSNPTVNTLRQERGALTAQYQKLLSDFGPDYPPVQAIRAQLAELNRQISQETSRITRTVSGDVARQYREAVANESKLAARVEQLKSGVVDLRRRSIQYNIFQRDVDTNRALYDALLQRYKEVGIAGGVGTNNISIIDRALVSNNPVKPNLKFNILVALLTGTFLGALAALLLEQLDESAVLSHDFQSKLGLPLLGGVPKLKSGDAFELLADPGSGISEAYLSVLTSVQFSTSHGTPRTLLVTSTQPGEGKSTTAFALAQSLAKLGKQVLLVDADMRNPSIHKSMGIANGGGLSNLLIGDGTIVQHVVASSLPNLWVITSGTIPPNAAELLAGTSLQEVLDVALEHYDHVIFDAPPVLGLADAPLLARAVEATVFVVESGRTRTSQARQALRRLTTVRAPLIGAVLTKLDIQRTGYGYGYGYDYSYAR
jgi:capsular exopolysaccharide synthesis family protein